MKLLHGIIIWCTVFFGVASAQNYYLSPSAGILNIYPPYNMSSDYQVDIVNQSNSALNDVYWEFASSTLLQGWDNSVCDWVNCYPGLPSGPYNPGPILAGANGYMKLSINPHAVAGTGNLKYLIYQPANQSAPDTIIFNVTPGGVPTGIKHTSDTGTSMQMFSGSYGEFLTPTLPGSFRRIEIYDILGNLLLSVTPSTLQSAGGRLSTLLPGVYLVKYEYPEGATVVRKLYKAG